MLSPCCALRVMVYRGLAACCVSFRHVAKFKQSTCLAELDPKRLDKTRKGIGQASKALYFSAFFLLVRSELVKLVTDVSVLLLRRAALASRSICVGELQVESK